MLVHQSPVLPNTVADAISSAVCLETVSYRAAVAYVTDEGARALVRILAANRGHEWKNIPRAIVTCFDFGHTEPAALEYLQAQEFEVRIANVGANGKIQLAPSPSSYHPKVYLAYNAVSVAAVIGSANLSRRAWTVNTEVVASAELSPEEASSLWNGIAGNSVELTATLLDAYKVIRPSQKSAQPADEPPVPSSTVPGALPFFRDAVEGGTVVPADYAAFWVETGGMRSGGSTNQLEVPRYANRFFGFNFSNYNSDRHVVGEVIIMTDAGSWPCQFAWHGDNGMERIYLPTTAKSGLAYPHRVVLFQRFGGGFRIAVADLGDPRDRQWREESAASGTLYRLGERSDRLCGLF